MTSDETDVEIVFFLMAYCYRQGVKGYFRIVAEYATFSSTPYMLKSSFFL